MLQKHDKFQMDMIFHKKASIYRALIALFRIIEHMYNTLNDTYQ